MHKIRSTGIFTGYVLSDYIKLRKEHRISGTLIGVTAAHAYDLTINGLPAVYSPFEAKILIDEGIAELVSTPDEVGQAVQEEYREYISDQVAKQTEKRRHQLTESKLLYQLPTECPHRDSSPAAENSILHSPAPDPVKYAVFRDLWRQNYFITNGRSFGGEFLIYPHDPIICHASHVVHVMDKPVITFKDFITANRLCVAVKKDSVFAYLDPENPKQIKYQSSIWNSTSNK